MVQRAGEDGPDWVKRRVGHLKVQSPIGRVPWFRGSKDDEAVAALIVREFGGGVVWLPGGRERTRVLTAGGRTCGERENGNQASEAHVIAAAG